MKIAALTVAFNEERFIKPCMKQLEGIEHLILISYIPWNGDIKPDDTYKLAGDKAILGDWVDEAEQRNYGLSQLEEYDWILIIDADEFYTKDQLVKLVNTLSTTDKDVVKAANMEVYYKGFTVHPKQTDNPIVAVRPHVKFIENRSAGDVPYDTTDAQMHHLSYARTDKEMKTKLSTFGHAQDIIPNWYEDVWLSGATTNLHPVNPPQFKSLGSYGLPDEIRRLFDD